MNELQKTELDLFCCFAEACEKLNLNYFLVCGSALGAARHQGVIPWDDDFDVGMYREDYNKFMELAPAILPEGIFLQNYKTDPAFPYVFAKLRNSNTTFVQTLMSDLNINHGVYIDIFPLDGYPEDAREQKKLATQKARYVRRLNCAFSTKPKTLRGKLVRAFFRMPQEDPKNPGKIRSDDIQISCPEFKNYLQSRNMVRREGLYLCGVLRKGIGCRI